MNPIRFHFIVPVWGEEYTRAFLKIALPSQLSKGNLGFFSKRREGDKYKIYTTSKDSSVIRQSPVYSRLTELIETEVHIIDGVINDINTGKLNKYDGMTICHARGLQAAVEDKAVAVLSGAEVIFSEGAFTRLFELASEGKLMVIIGGYRIATGTFAPALLEKYYSPADQSVTVSPRELVKLSLEHIHPDSRILFWNSKEFMNSWPAFLFWDVPGEGVIQRGIHLHPLMINPVSGNASLAPTAGMGIDGYDYMMRAVPEFDSIHFVDDSDELTCLALHSPPPGAVSYLPGKAGVLDIAYWINRHCCDYHVRFLGRKIRFHAYDLSDEWERAEEETDRAVSSIVVAREFLKRVPEACNSLENFQEELRRRDRKIIELVDLMKRMNWDNAGAHNKLGEEFYKTGRMEQAEELMNKALSLSPDRPDVHANLAVLHLERDNLQKASEHSNIAIKLQPQMVSAWLTLAEIYYRAGLIDEARGCLEHAVSLSTGDVEILMAMADMALKLDNISAARKCLDRLENAVPSHPVLQVLRQACAVSPVSGVNAL